MSASIALLHLFMFRLLLCALCSVAQQEVDRFDVSTSGASVDDAAILLQTAGSGAILRDQSSEFLDPATCPGRGSARREAYAFVCATGCKRHYLESQGRLWARRIRQSDAVRDIVVLVAEGDPTRPEVEEWVMAENLALGGGVRLVLQPDALARPPPALMEIMERHGCNCCGWREMRNLWVWNLTMYDRVMYIEMDVWLVEPVEELFRCRHPWIGTIGPQSAINGGMFVLSPSAETFASMLEILATSHYDHASGWNRAGQPAPVFWDWGRFGCDRKWKRGLGSETMQGFLQYYWFELGHGGRKVDMGLYNYCYCHIARSYLRTFPALDPRLYAACFNAPGSPNSTELKVKIVHKPDEAVAAQLARADGNFSLRRDSSAQGHPALGALESTTRDRLRP